MSVFSCDEMQSHLSISGGLVAAKLDSETDNERQIEKERAATEQSPSPARRVLSPSAEVTLA